MLGFVLAVGLVMSSGAVAVLADEAMEKSADQVESAGATNTAAAERVNEKTEEEPLKQEDTVDQPEQDITYGIGTEDGEMIPAASEGMREDIDQDINPDNIYDIEIGEYEDGDYEVSPVGAASDFTADQAVSWVAGYENIDITKVGGYNSQWGNQCVALVAVYQNHLGVPVSYVGNAYNYAYWSASSFSPWQQIKGADPQKGDVLIWTDGDYGHCGIYVSDNVTYEVNNKNSGLIYDGKVEVTKIKKCRMHWSGYWGVLRPNFKSGGGNPIGHVDSISSGQGTVTLRGWVFDPDIPSHQPAIHVFADGANQDCVIGTGVSNQYRPDVNKAYNGQIGDYHGFEFTLNTDRVGDHVIYVYAINESGTSGTNVQLNSGGTHVDIKPVYNPTGDINNIEGGIGVIKIRGWVFDWDDASKQLEVHVFADGAEQKNYIGKGIANAKRTDVNEAHNKQVGDYHGIDLTINTTLSGKHTIYVYAINIGSGKNIRIPNDGVAATITPKISVTGVSLNKSSVNMNIGKAESLIATVAPSNATNKSVTWSSDNTNVASVNQSGVVTAKSAGKANITVKSDDGGKIATCTIIVGTVPTIVTNSLPDGKMGENYYATLQATGTAPITWSKTAGNLPTGLTVNSNGTITGTPTAAGTYSFTVQAKNNWGSVTKQLSLAIGGIAPTVTTTAIPEGKVGVPYSFTLSASGTQPITWHLSLVGVNFRGLSVDSSTATISGTPTTGGIGFVRVWVENAYGKSASVDIPIVISADKPEILNEYLPDATLGELYCETLYISNMVGDNHFVEYEGEQWLTYEPESIFSRNDESFTMRGYPQMTGTFTFKLKYDNGYGTAEKEFTVNVKSKTGDDTVKKYTVTFVSNGKTYKTYEVLSGAKIYSPETPVREGYVFGGWFIDSKYTEEYDFSTAVTSNLKLYAKWTKNDSEPGDGEEEETDYSAFMIVSEKLSLSNTVFEELEEKPDRYIVKNSRIAAISKDMLTGKKAGTTTVEAQVNRDGKYQAIATCEVSVMAKPKFKFTRPFTYEGQSFNAADYLICDDDVARAVTLWESAKGSVVEVNDEKEGIFEVTGPGIAKITAYFGEKGKTGTVKLSATATVKLPSFAREEYKLVLGAKQTLSMKNVSGSMEPEWEIDGDDILELSGMTNKQGVSTGKVTIFAAGAGESTLTATIDGQEYSCRIVVPEPTLSSEELELKPGGSKIISVKGSKLKKSDIEWSSEDEEIATVVGGKVKAISSGETVISAIVGNTTLECLVVVTE